MLKMAGLERNVVILVFFPTPHKKILFQLFKGASRGKVKLMMLVQKAILKT